MTGPRSHRSAALLDPVSRAWWRTVGRRVDLEGEHAWLQAPTSSGSLVRDTWLAEEAERLGGHVSEGRADAGLVADLSELDGPGFTAGDLRPEVRDFYEHTAAWRMEVWTGWQPFFWPGGELVARLFGRRVGQLALPMRPLDVAHGMDSRVSVIADEHEVQLAAGWLRTLRSSGEYVFSGCYSHRRLPGADRPSVHVAFPLEQGNVQVFLRPEVGPDGSLVLESPAGAFGSDGCYVSVRHRGRAFAARAPVHERFHVYVDEEGVLRTDHHLSLWSARAVTLHYRLEPLVRPAASPGA
ncbi:hypothetical protein [uncultured Nocardioides sp.]|uniref:hypothetical protein n=1 Tax=uncultured Nocardioides sp. TaxID=198441 RepID=UPI0030F58D38